MGLHSKPTSSRASNIRRVGRQSSFALIAAAVVGLHKALNFAENFIPSSRLTIQQSSNSESVKAPRKMELSIEHELWI